MEVRLKGGKMPQAQAPKRDATWDIARGIGMVLVIYGHLLEPIYQNLDWKVRFESAAVQWQVIYSFHMMLFFLISGAVNRNLPKKAWPEVLRGSLRLLALAWVVHILGTFVVLAEDPEIRSSVWNVVYAFVDPIVEGYKWSVGVLWFLTSLCFVQILAYFTLRRFPALAVALVAMAATAVTVYLPNFPEQYLLKTWMPGLAFFALGYLFSQWQFRWPFWAALPLLAATIVLARSNHGCSFSFTEVCGTVPFSVRMFAGSYGFLPVFFLSSLAGSLTVVSLSAGLARFSASSLLAYMGRKSLELFIINGFVATFLFPYFWHIQWPQLTVFHYIGLLVAIVAAHLAALQILKPALDWINAAALAIAGLLGRLFAGEADKAEARPA
jgi:fucose 4-O-acetylase-like acetyltransferase